MGSGSIVPLEPSVLARVQVAKAENGTAYCIFLLELFVCLLLCLLEHLILSEVHSSYPAMRISRPQESQDLVLERCVYSVAYRAACLRVRRSAWETSVYSSLRDAAHLFRFAVGSCMSMFFYLV